MNENYLELGSKMPGFSLISTEDKLYSEKDFPDSEAIVIIFSCNHCPYVKAYEERIKNIQSSFEDRIKVIAINSNDSENYSEDSFEKMKQYYQEKEFNFLYLRDETQQAAKDFKATHTPEVFLFDKNRILVYKGKIDDNWQHPEKVKTPYLELAITELLEGKKISIPETFSIGCTIKWEKDT